MVFAHRLELLPRLRGNDIVMSVKVEHAFSTSITGNQTDWTLASTFLRVASLQALAFQAPFSHSVLKKIGARPILFSRRILHRYVNQLGQQRSHLVLALLQPFH